MKISVSFKNNKTEQRIYDHIVSKLNYSVYLKELVLADMENEKKTLKNNEENSTKSMGIEW